MIFNHQAYPLTMRQENMELIIYALLGFLAPLCLGHPQLLVGIVVNTVLVLTALNLRSWASVLLIVLLPSLGVILRGVIVQPLDAFTKGLVPFVWAANMLLVLAVKYCLLQKAWNKWPALTAAALIKALFLVIIVCGLVMIGLGLKPMVIKMGTFQFLTAMLGGAIAFIIQSVKRRLRRSVSQ